MTDPKRAEPNEHAQRLREAADEALKYHPHDGVMASRELNAAAGEIERLAALVEMERKAAEDRLELVNRLEKANAQQAADYARLTARVRELEEKAAPLTIPSFLRRGSD